MFTQSKLQPKKIIFYKVSEVCNLILVVKGDRPLGIQITPVLAHPDRPRRAARGKVLKKTDTLSAGGPETSVRIIYIISYTRSHL